MNDQPSTADFVQASRILRIVSPLGEDVLLPEQLTVSEAVNDLFAIELTVRSKQNIAPDELIGELIDVEMEVAAGGLDEEPVYRTWNGLVVALSEGPAVTRGFRQYRLTIRPQLWLLSQRSDCRIWQNQSALNVLETLFSEHGLPAADTSGVVGTIPPQLYSVQWNETDLDFLRRRLEEDGLFFFFHHEKGLHRLHVANHASGWLGPSVSAGGEARVRIAMGSADRNTISEWTRNYAYVPGARAGGDFNFETPKADVRATTPSLVSLPGNAKSELYEYPSRVGTIEEAERAKKLRTQAIEADHTRVFGSGNVRVLETGRRFSPYDEANPDVRYDDHVIVRAVHEVVDRSYETNGQEPEYQNVLEAVPASVPLTPHRSTPRPKIDGTQIGIIAGPSSEEIHIDKYARVKVWWPWDRRAKKDGSDTKWIEVVQSWGGGTWGARINPRIGMQAICAFENGDPDRPYVIGLVANPDNMPPYDLPAHKTRTVLRSNTHKGTGHNELAFEDEAGKENMFLHAQKDQTVKVLNNQTSRVDSNALHSVGANHALEIGSNMSQQVGGGMNMVVGGVGGLVNVIAGGLLGGLAAKSAGLLQQAMSLVASAAADRPSSGDRNAEAAGASVDAPGSSGGDAGTGEMLAQAGGYTGLMASGALGAMTASMDSIRGGVNGAMASELRTDAGDAMRNSGSQFGSQVASMIGQGVFNTLVSRMQNTSVGVAQTEQIGVAKVTTVGQVYKQMVGDTKHVMIGKELCVEVGGGKDEDGNDQPPKSVLIMKDDGTILLKGTNIYIDAENHIQLIAPMTDNN